MLTQFPKVISEATNSRNLHWFQFVYVFNCLTVSRFIWSTHIGGDQPLNAIIQSNTYTGITWLPVLLASRVFLLLYISRASRLYINHVTFGCLRIMWLSVVYVSRDHLLFIYLLTSGCTLIIRHPVIIMHITLLSVVSTSCDFRFHGILQHYPHKVQVQLLGP